MYKVLTIGGIIRMSHKLIGTVISNAVEQAILTLIIINGRKLNV